MVQQHTSTEQLNATFAALADPTRRAILARLASGETSVTELAEPFEMSMPAISKHLKVLQRAGLIERGREAQWRPCRLAAGPLKDAADWLEHYRRFWEESVRSPRGLSARATKRANRKRRSTRMAARNSSAAESTDRELVITRVFDAPRELIWKALTVPEHLEHWWGPKGITSRVHQLDLRPGGTFLYSQRTPEGRKCGASGSIGKSSRRSDSYSSNRLPTRRAT